MPSELGIRSFELIEQFAWNNEGMRFSSCLCFRKISPPFCLCFRKVLPLFCLCFRKLSLSLQKETTI